MEQPAGRLKQALPRGIEPQSPATGPAIIASAEPHAFWSMLLGAMEAGVAAALFDPAWPDEWKVAMTERARALPSGGPPAILIATSGSTGIPKFCHHDAATIGCAAQGYAERFGARGIIHAVSVLPQHHVGGLMAAWRCAAAGGRVHFADYRDAAALAAAPFPLEHATISLVPTQLHRMLAEHPLLALLRRFGLILVGGAAADQTLLERARAAGLRLCPCYGATETAAMVTALEPDAFLAGAGGVGTALPHARVEVDAEQRVLVRAGSLLRGYLPQPEGFSRDPYRTGDLGRIDASGSLHILGRADRVIITGGEKVHPEQVEAAAMASGLVDDAECTGVADPDWGMRVELRVKASGGADVRARLLASLRACLPPYAVPKVVRFE